LKYLSVDHPQLINEYREADEIRARAEGGGGDTEELE
jgi:hypothetical protein